MRSHVVGRSVQRRLAVCLCVAGAWCLAGALLAIPAHALIVNASGHRFGLVPRVAPGVTAAAAAPGPQAQAEDLLATVSTSSTSTTTASSTTSDTSTGSTTATATVSTNSTTISSGDTTTTSATTAFPLVYHNGPVLRDHATYAIYWDASNWDPAGDAFPATFVAGVNQYFQDVASASGANTNEYSVLTQYGDSTGPGVYASTFGGYLLDTDPYPSNDGTGGCAPSSALPSGYTACLSDAQVQQEISAVVSANRWPDTANAIYFVFLPSGVDECFSGPDGNELSQGCADGAGQNPFCSYHSYFGSGQPPLYAVLPWADVPGCQTGMSPNGSGGDDPLDDQLSLVSHEHSETITDPFGTSWYASNGDEVADGCTNPDQFGPLMGVAPDQYDETIAGDDYILQEDFSNDGAACRARYVARFTAPTKPLIDHAASFDARASSASPATITSYTWDFGDGSPELTGWNPYPTHIYTQAGVYTVTLTTTDSDGTTDSVSHTVAVSTVSSQFTAPTQADAGQPVAFNGSSSLGAVTSYAWDFGDGFTGSGVAPTHTYLQAGTYTVTLTVSDKGGETSSSSQQLTVGPAPPPNQTSPQGPTPDSGGSVGASSGGTGTSPAPAPPSTSPGSGSNTEPATKDGPVAGPAPRAAAAQATIARVAGATVDRRDEHTVAHTGEVLYCPRGVSECVAAITLIHVASHPNSSASAAERSIAVTLAASRLVIPAGGHAEIALDLSASAVRLLRSAGHLRADLEIVANAVGGASTTRVLAITLTAPA